MRNAAAGWLFVLAVLPGCWRPASVDESIFLQRGGLLEVDLDYGEGLRPDPGALEVSAHDLDEVHILGEADGWGSWDVVFRVDAQAAKGPNREGDASPESVRLVASVNGAFSWLFGGPRVRMRIRVPRETRLDLRCSDGPIRVDDVHGRVRVRTGYGSIEATGVEGPLRLRTGQGDIRVTDSVGNVHAKATSGEIELRWVKGDVEALSGDGGIEVAHVSGRLEVRTDSGDLVLEAIEGPVRGFTERGTVTATFGAEPSGSLETRRGSLDVTIPATSGVQLDAVSRRGSVELARGITVDGLREDAQVAGAIGGGGPPLRLYTTRGTVRVGLR